MPLAFCPEYPFKVESVKFSRAIGRCGQTGIANQWTNFHLHFAELLMGITLNSKSVASGVFDGFQELEV